MKTCETCKHWQTIPTHGSDRGDEAMAKLGYKNCAGIKDEFSFARFVHMQSVCNGWDGKI